MVKQAKRATILVVDDEMSIRELLADVLSEEGYAVETGGNGQEALRRLALTQPVLVISDIMMPELDGWEFLTIVRANPDWQKLPVILMSAGQSFDSHSNNLGRHTALLRKPFTLAALLDLVDQFVMQSNLN